jgi:hypothetical protein
VIATAAAGLLACFAGARFLAPALALLLALPLGVAWTFCAVIAGAWLGALLGVGTGLLVFAGQLSGVLLTAALARVIAQILTGLS